MSAKQRSAARVAIYELLSLKKQNSECGIIEKCAIVALAAPKRVQEVDDDTSRSRDDQTKGEGQCQGFTPPIAPACEYRRLDLPGPGNHGKARNPLNGDHNGFVRVDAGRNDDAAAGWQRECAPNHFGRGVIFAALYRMPRFR